MQRPMLFRAWDTTNKKWAYIGFSVFGEVTIFNLLDQYKLEEACELLEITEFIGLQDKFGKYIYEGDIIAHDRQDRVYSKKAKTFRVLCVVEWDSGNNASVEVNPQKLVNPSLFNTEPRFHGKLIGDQNGSYDWSEFHNCEIVGNIYDNPDLLAP